MNRKNYTWSQLIAYFGAALAVFKVLSKLKAVVMEWTRCKKLLLLLPRYHGPKKHQHQIPFLGDFNQFLPNDVPYSPDNIAKNMLIRAQEIFDNDLNKDDGLLMTWYVDPKIPGPPIGTILLKDINLIKQLTSTKMLPYLKKGFAYEISHPLIGNGILATSGKKWHKQRVILERGFVPSIIKKQYPEVVKTANDLVSRIHMMASKTEEGYVTVDVPEEMLMTTIDVLGRVAFSYEFGSLKAAKRSDAPLYDTFDTVLYNIAQRVRNPLLHVFRNIPIGKHNIETKRGLNHLFKTVRTIVHSRAADKNKVPQDLLDVMLLEEDAETKTKLSEQEMVDNIATLLFAGHDTTAAALTWFCYLIAKTPEIGENILNELNTKWGGEITMENMERSDYLNACTLELLRLYPSAGFTRQPTEDIQLGKYVIPKGADIMVLPVIVQRNEEYYENAKAFVPERWMKDKSKENLGFQARLAKETLQNPLLPFSLGKRNCVGRPLALLEIRVVLLRLLQEFEFQLPAEPHPEFQDTPWMGLTAYPNHIKVNFSPKKK